MHSEPAAAKQAILHIVRRSPRELGVERTRWTLRSFLAVLGWPSVTSPSGASRLLHRLGLSFQRARDYIRSPDPDYDAKLRYIQECRTAAQASHGREVFLYEDEVTYYRQPTLTDVLEERGCQPRAHRSLAANTPTRVAATLDPDDGRVVYYQASTLSVDKLVAFYQRLRAAYPDAHRLWVVEDNWSIHFHPNLLVALEPQVQPFRRYTPSSWPPEASAWARRRWEQLQLPIQVVPLPTYASWCNPIEKLWRKLRQDLLHLHPFANDLPKLRQSVGDFLEQFAHGSSELLRYVGLLLPA